MRTSTCADSNASATVAYTKPWLAEPAAAARLCPAADRDTPDDNVRSSASSIAATIGGAVHPVIPAKQTLTMGRLYAATIARAPGPGSLRTLRLAVVQHGRGNGHESCVVGAARAVPTRLFRLSQAEVAQIYRGPRQAAELQCAFPGGRPARHGMAATSPAGMGQGGAEMTHQARREG